MATIIQVPINTMLADLDESLRTLLKRELDRHGFDGIEIVFEAPDKEWAASLSTPAVNLFMYDIREAKDYRPIEWDERTTPEGHTFDVRPPLRIDASYAVTAWTRAVEDEHRLLSQTMAVLYAYPTLPDEVLTSALSNGSQRFPLRIAHLAQESAARGRLRFLECRGRLGACTRLRSTTCRHGFQVRGRDRDPARPRRATIGDDAPLRPRQPRGDDARAPLRRRRGRGRRREPGAQRLGERRRDRTDHRDRRGRPGLPTACRPAPTPGPGLSAACEGEIAKAKLQVPGPKAEIALGKPKAAGGPRVKLA